MSKIALLNQIKGLADQVIALCEDGGPVDPPIDPPPTGTMILDVKQEGQDKEGNLIFKIASRDNLSAVTDQRSGGHRAFSHTGDYIALKHMDLETSRADIIILSTKTFDQWKVATWGATGAELCWAYSSDHLWMHDTQNGSKLYKLDVTGKTVKTIDLPREIDGLRGGDQPKIRTFWQTGFFGAQKTQFLYTVALDNGLWNAYFQPYDGDSGELGQGWWHRDATNFASLKDPFPLNTDHMLCTFRESPHEYTRISTDGRQIKTLKPEGVPWSHAMPQPEGELLLVTVRGDIVCYNAMTGNEVQRITQQQLKAAITPNLTAPDNWVSSIYYAMNNEIAHVYYKTGIDTTQALPSGIIEYNFATNTFKLLVDDFKSKIDFRVFHTTGSSSLHKSGKHYSWKYSEGNGDQICTYFVRR